MAKNIQGLTSSEKYILKETLVKWLPDSTRRGKFGAGSIAKTLTADLGTPYTIIERSVETSALGEQPHTNKILQRIDNIFNLMNAEKRVAEVLVCRLIPHFDEE